MPAAVARSKGQRVINVYGFSFPPLSSSPCTLHPLHSPSLSRTPFLSFRHRSLIPSPSSSSSSAPCPSRSRRYTDGAIIASSSSISHTLVAHTTPHFLSVALTRRRCTHTHTRTHTRTRHVVRLKGAETRNRLRLDSTRRPTGHKTWPRLKRIVFSSYSSLSLSLFLFWSVAIVRRGPRSVLSLRSLRPRRGSSFDANTFPAFFLLSLALSSSFLLLLSRFLLRPILPRPQTPDSTFAFRVAELPLKAAPLRAGEISRGGEGRGERGARGGEGKDVAGDDRRSLDAEEDRLDLKSTKS